MFGAGTDYCLLIVSRFRDELRRERRRRGGDAARGERTGPAIFASGGIVVAAMLVLSLADFNATREMGPLLALGIVVMMACGADAAAGAAGRVRAPRVLARDPARGERAARGEPGLDAHRRARAAPPGAARRRLGRGARRRRARQPRRPRLPRPRPSSTATRPSPSRARQLIRERFDPPGRVAPLDVVADSEVALEVKDALAQRARRRAVEHRLAVRGRQADLLRGAAEDRPVLDAGDGPDPAPARGRARGRGRQAGADRRDHRRELRQPRGAERGREADRAARAGADPARADRAAALRRRAAVRDRRPWCCRSRSRSGRRR